MSPSGARVARGRAAIAATILAPVVTAAQPPGEPPAETILRSVDALADRVVTRVNAPAFRSRVARATDPDAARAAVREVLVLAVRTALEPLVQAGWAEEPEKKPATEAEQNRVIDAFGAQLVDLEDIVRTVDVRGIQARLAGGADDAALQTEVRRIALPGIRGTADAMVREYREIQASEGCG